MSYLCEKEAKLACLETAFRYAFCDSLDLRALRAVKIHPDRALGMKSLSARLDGAGPSSTHILVTSGRQPGPTPAAEDELCTGVVLTPLHGRPSQSRPQSSCVGARESKLADILRCLVNASGDCGATSPTTSAEDSQSEDFDEEPETSWTSPRRQTVLEHAAVAQNLTQPHLRRSRARLMSQRDTALKQVVERQAFQSRSPFLKARHSKARFSIASVLPSDWILDDLGNIVQPGTYDCSHISSMDTRRAEILGIPIILKSGRPINKRSAIRCLDAVVTGGALSGITDSDIDEAIIH